MGSGLAYVRGEWVKCHSEYYSVFRGRSLKGARVRMGFPLVEIATTEPNFKTYV
jgi:hypothetical protein